MGVKEDRQDRGSIGQFPTGVARIADDPEAFEDFYRGNIEAVQRFVARRVDDPYLAADLTADVFLAAIDSAHTYRPGRVEPIGWLYGIARNVVASERRRAARERRAARRLPPSSELIEADDLVRLHARIDAEAASRRLYLAMDGLSEGEHAVLELVALEELSASEAARVLGIRPIAARVRLHRARRLLQRELGPGVADNARRLSEASQ
jgi:RNA polymerase sigma factor (sigma-70 family)